MKRYWLLFLPVLLLLPGITGFPYPSPEGVYSDVAISHYPNALFLKRTVIETGQIPLWSPTILSGYPFFANPLSGLHYPPGWLALLFPLPLGLNLTVLLHLLWGGVGMYIYLRSQQLSHLSALFSAIAFESLPKIFAHFGAGHITLLYAVSWTPWLFYVRANTRWNRMAMPAIVFAFIFLSDPRWAAIAGIAWFFQELATRDLPPFDRLKRFGRSALIAAFLAAPLAIPLAEYTLRSTRMRLLPEDVLAFSMPPARLLGILFPDFSGFHEWTVYFGGAVCILLLVALFSHNSTEMKKYWAWVFVISLVFSMGNHLPMMKLFASLPGFSLLRVPARSLFLTGFAAVILAGVGLDRVSQRLEEKEKKRVRLAVVFLVAATIVFSLAIWSVRGALPTNIVWGTGFIFLGGCWIIWLVTKTKIDGWMQWGLFAMLLIDLGYTNQTLFAYRTANDVLGEGSQVAEYLASIPGNFRVYSPSYSIPQQTAAYYSLQLTDGVDPLQLEDYADYMERATGIPRNGYSITLPPYHEEDPATANETYLPNSLLSALNVRFVVSEFAMDIGDSTSLRKGNAWVYKMDTTPEYARIEPGSSNLVEVISRSPNRIDVRAEGPGTLILSEIPYPGWQVFVDGSETAMKAYNSITRSVDLMQGEHQVTFALRPISLYLGLGISVLAWGILLRSYSLAKKQSHDE